MQIGCKKWNLKNFKIKETKERIYSLGTWFYKDPTLTVKQNTIDKLECFKRELQKWKPYQFTLFGKNNVLKTFALSKLTFQIQNVETTEDFVNDVQNLIIDFIWNKKKPKIKNETAMKPVNQGGINLVHFENHVKSLKLSWIKRMITEDNWTGYIKTFLPNLTMKQFLECSIDPEHLPDIIPYFYKQILK